ncbi:hypothetical protein [Streptomyces sp. SID3343]|uniref:hypothetical protein n=1 Tax=Streptomyces sp. SID3343 TaxID=2690260 RepID=UPI001369BC9A|nr:hypothetical protein [Streptomyces sp. SID3343]MYV97708.1 hypothetical protein [Streptomyces sp. SID3343]
MEPLLAAALDALGVEDTPRPLTPHHTHAWRVGDWRVRTATDRTRARPLHHEAHAVALLYAHGLYPVAGAHGHVGDGLWTAVEWRPGRTLWEWCAPARASGGACFAPRLAEFADRAFDTLARLHAAGWRHGDIQPMNIVITATGAVEFIDHDLTHHRDLLPLRDPYRGGMDHFTAPEVARRRLDTESDVDIELTDVAEVYSLGASIRAAWTGTDPATDRTAGRYVTPADVLEDVATGRRRTPLAAERPWADPDLEALIEATMDPDPTARVRHLAALPGIR